MSRSFANRFLQEGGGEDNEGDNGSIEKAEKEEEPDY